MKKHAVSLAILCFMVLALCGSASADSVSGTTISTQSGMNTTDLPSNRHIFINVSNDGGVKYNNDSAYYVGPNGTYYIKADGGGLNELHIAYTNSTDYNSTTGKYLNYGEVTVVNSTSLSSSGVFYLTNTGGRGFTDDIILLLSVKGPISDNFSVTIISNGYTWTLPAVAGAYQPPTPTDYHYITGVNETFTKSDFQYGPHVYKPGPGTSWTLPLYYGQDTSDNSTAEYLMFIDLYVGNIKSTSVPGLIDNGAVKVQYVFNNLNTTASFNMYGWTLASNQGEGISWTNKVVLGDTQSSGYTVNYKPVTPVADFSADNTSGSSPLTVKFTDNSSNYPTSWLWDFGDGVTSTEQNPTHTYTKPGNYTVTLTTSNLAGNSTLTKTSYITVPKSDVYVNIIPSNSNPQIGDTVTYKFKLGNNGPGIAKNVVYTYTIPEGLEYDGAIVDQGTVTYNATTRTLTWNLGDVAVGDPNLWLQLKVLTAGNYNIQPTVTVGGTTLESNINSLQVNAASPTTTDPETVNAATTTKTVPMKTTGMPITALISALLLIGSGIAINRKK
ncbi:PKD domain-containing protein [Methanobacterium congolense]|uniref:Protease 1 n=1 Tax=Methanobacterium congolense TaxID=118062 RepID=A0A1D3KZH5_9EURY|nr:PKD domain-containing protein [Methanobacterium congolense]SCG84725.1 Protease 1 [Methanobacterium congolense]